MKIDKKKIQNILFIIAVIVVSIAMFYFIGKKEGFHEDEIFSYGSSNYRYDNVFQAAADKDSINRTLDELVVKDNLIDTLAAAKYYIIDHNEIFSESFGKKIATDLPVWKTPEQAKDYLTVSNEEIFSYYSVLFNQGRDVHPPLFYMLVHLVSSICLNVFSKYIIFAINLSFFIGICIVIRKIFKLYDKEYLAIPAVLLFGLSMGAASTVILLRMYAILTFFCLLYLYINLKIAKNDFIIEKKIGRQLVITTILGFLTQYYFCIFAIVVFIIMMIRMFTLKYKKEALKYFTKHIVSAIIGVLLFVPCIYHIFFSYRKPGSLDAAGYISRLKTFIEIIFNAYSIPVVVGSIVTLAVLVYLIIKVIRSKEKGKKIFEIAILGMPLIAYLLIITRISPTIDERYMIRYIMPILPLVGISATLVIDSVLSEFLENKEKVKLTIIYTLVLAISIIGFLTNEPKYLYKGYNKYLEIAEKYKDLDYVYVCDNAFTYLNSLPEFLIYNKTLIVNAEHDDLKILGENEELQSQEQFILTIKKWMNVEDTLNKVLEASKFTKHEVLLDQNDDTESVIYLVSR